MIRVNIEADAHLPRYIDLVERGEVVGIYRDGQPVAKIHAVETSPTRLERAAGSMKASWISGPMRSPR